MAKYKKICLQNQEKIYKNEMHIKYKKEVYSTKFSIIFRIFFVLILLFNSSLLTIEKSLEIRKLDSSSTIKIVIEGPGTKKVLGSNFDYSPDLVYINSIQKSTDNSNEYYLNETINIVVLTFFQELDSCANMFYDLKDIKEIDLSKCVYSKVTDMSYMFKGCIKLTSLNIIYF